MEKPETWVPKTIRENKAYGSSWTKEEVGSRTSRGKGRNLQESERGIHTGTMGQSKEF